MKPFKIDNLEIGDGKPKICVPITAASSDDIIAEGSKILTTDADIVMLRLDYMDDLLNIEKTIQTIKSLRYWTSGIPLVVDLRTPNSGANIKIVQDDIQSILVHLITYKLVNAIKIDDRLKQNIQMRLKNVAYNNNIKIFVVHYYLLNHPTQEQLMTKMSQLEKKPNIDMIEISIIPTKKLQILDLMQACLKSSDKYDHPIIISSVGPLGKTIQIASKSCDNSIIYEPLNKANYLGQLSITQLRSINQLL